MPKKILLDSSVYISSLNTEDIFHRQTKEFAQRLKNKKIEIVVPVLVVLEVANILQQPAEDVFYIFEDGLLVNLDLAITKEIIPLLKNIKLKTSDAVIAATAKIYEAGIISWDKKLVKESKKLVFACTPKEYLQELKK